MTTIKLKKLKPAPPQAEGRTPLRPTGVKRSRPTLAQAQAERTVRRTPWEERPPQRDERGPYQRADEKPRFGDRPRPPASDRPAPRGAAPSAPGTHQRVDPRKDPRADLRNAERSAPRNTQRPSERPYARPSERIAERLAERAQPRTQLRTDAHTGGHGAEPPPRGDRLGGPRNDLRNGPRDGPLNAERRPRDEQPAPADARRRVGPAADRRPPPANDRRPGPMSSDRRPAPAHDRRSGPVADQRSASTHERRPAPMQQRQPPARPDRPTPPTPPLQPASAAAAEQPRLSKRMSELGLASRREADEWIARGLVRVDGVVVDQLGARVWPTQQISIDPEAHNEQSKLVTILLHKPLGIVSGQAEDGHAPAATLVNAGSRWPGDHHPLQFHPSQLHHLVPAGRLDIDSTGLLVLTQDGRVAKALIGADTKVEKEYVVHVAWIEQPGEAKLNETFPADKLELLRQGLELDKQALKPAKVSWQNETHLRFVLREGKRRQIRRMCEAVGLQVLGLKRIRVGRIGLGEMAPGQWRYLGPFENFL